MSKQLIYNAIIVNENSKFLGHVLIHDERIAYVGSGEPTEETFTLAESAINADGKLLIPGLIDDQVHFREPGLTHKGDIFSESRAAVAGGITSFMEMPNTNPGATTGILLEEKFKRASEVSLANYSFFMGTTNDNADEVLRQDYKTICGIKIFLGSSTGNMLVNNQQTIEKLFEFAKVPILVHCEDDLLIAENLEKYQKEFGENLNPTHHPQIRSEEACYNSSSKTVALARKFNTRLHVLHISTAKELSLFDAEEDIRKKRITAEACVHHCWFNQEAYETKENFIKWNPAVKSEKDRLAILDAINSNRIDVLATDHAPHTFEEKSQTYLKAPSGGPLVQHALLAWLDLWKQGVLTLEKIVEKACHNPALLFDVEKRGYIKPGYFADLVLIDLNQAYQVTKENILYKCKWSPFEGHTFQHRIEKTWVNGAIVYDNGQIIDKTKGQRLTFLRN